MSNTIDELPNEIDLVSLLSGKSETVSSSKISETKIPEPTTKDDKYIDCENSTNIYSKKCNSELLAFEKEQGDYLKENEQNDITSPLLDDPNFNMKITRKKEFADMGYNGVILYRCKKAGRSAFKRTV